MKNKFFTIIVGIMFSPIGIVNAHVGEDYSDHHSWMMGNYWNFGGALMWIFMILVIVGLVLFIVYLIKKIQQENKIKIKRRSKKNEEKNFS